MPTHSHPQFFWANLWNYFTHSWACSLTWLIDRRGILKYTHLPPSYMQVLIFVGKVIFCSIRICHCHICARNLHDARRDDVMPQHTWQSKTPLLMTWISAVNYEPVLAHLHRFDYVTSSVCTTHCNHSTIATKSDNFWQNEDKSQPRLDLALQHWQTTYLAPGPHGHTEIEACPLHPSTILT